MTPTLTLDLTHARTSKSLRSCWYRRSMEHGANSVTDPGNGSCSDTRKVRLRNRDTSVRGTPYGANAGVNGSCSDLRKLPLRDRGDQRQRAPYDGIPGVLGTKQPPMAGGFFATGHRPQLQLGCRSAHWSLADAAHAICARVSTSAGLLSAALSAELLLPQFCARPTQGANGPRAAVASAGWKKLPWLAPDPQPDVGHRGVSRLRANRAGGHAVFETVPHSLWFSGATPGLQHDNG